MVQIGKCIDFFNNVGELMAKMIGKEKYKSVFELLRKKSKEMRDQKRLSECLTSLGIKEIYHCSCLPGALGDEAAEEAKKYLVEADRIQCSPDLSISAGNSRAQCLSKLGRCLAKEGKFREGKEKIQQAIDIRQRHGDQDIEDKMMLAVTYNDMAGMCHLFLVSSVSGEALRQKIVLFVNTAQWHQPRTYPGQLDCVCYSPTRVPCTVEQCLHNIRLDFRRSLESVLPSSPPFPNSGC